MDKCQHDWSGRKVRNHFLSDVEVPTCRRCGLSMWMFTYLNDRVPKKCCPMCLGVGHVEISKSRVAAKLQRRWTAEEIAEGHARWLRRNQGMTITEAMHHLQMPINASTNAHGWRDVVVFLRKKWLSLGIGCHE